MKPTAKEIAAAVGQEAGCELDAAVRKIKHCLAQLTDEQLWWRPAPTMNSIANLLLHLGGNVRQWLVAGLSGVEDTRDRPSEFAARGPVPKETLVRRLDEIVREARTVLEQVSPTNLLERRGVQGFEVTGLEAIFQSVAHFRGHAQEVVHLTRSQLGDAYKFDFVPAGPEQGAP